jgi:hypothetical protein
VSLEQRISSDAGVALSGHRAVGRRLIGTDRINRRPAGDSGSVGWLSSQLPVDTTYRSNFGASSFHALTATGHYRAGWAQFHAAYTWSHSIDNQSDPLQGTFDDLNLFRGFNAAGSGNVAALTQESDSRLDRGSSDFDQRHNLVFLSIWELPPASGKRGLRRALFGWQFSQVAGFRSGVPFNIIAVDGLVPCAETGPPARSELVRARPGFIFGADPWLTERQPVPGGFRLMNSKAFCGPSSGTIGNLGRNAFTGPGFWNLDVSLARSFPLRVLREGARLQLRVDFFNALNHANLGNPYGLLDSSFGIASLGRQGVRPAFPSSVPLDQLPRQIQLQLKLFF